MERLGFIEINDEDLELLVKAINEARLVDEYYLDSVLPELKNRWIEVYIPSISTETVYYYRILEKEDLSDEYINKFVESSKTFKSDWIDWYESNKALISSGWASVIPTVTPFPTATIKPLNPNISLLRPTPAYRFQMPTPTVKPMPTVRPYKWPTDRPKTLEELLDDLRNSFGTPTPKPISTQKPQTFLADSELYKIYGPTPTPTPMPNDVNEITKLIEELLPLANDRESMILLATYYAARADIYKYQLHKNNLLIQDCVKYRELISILYLDSDPKHHHCWSSYYGE
jgi:hypothetical protein